MGQVGHCSFRRRVDCAVPPSRTEHEFNKTLRPEVQSGSGPIFLSEVGSDLTASGAGQATFCFLCNMVGIKSSRTLWLQAQARPCRLVQACEAFQPSAPPHAKPITALPRKSSSTHLDSAVISKLFAVWCFCPLPQERGAYLYALKNYNLVCGAVAAIILSKSNSTVTFSATYWPVRAINKFSSASL